jgi:hypothetical protein
MPRLPKTVYVRYDGETNSQFLRAEKDAVDLLEAASDTQIVGVYELKGYSEVKSTVTVSVREKTSSRPKR